MFEVIRREVADSIMTTSPIYVWFMKYAGKREEKKMKTAMYRQKVEADSLVLARSRDITGLVCLSLNVRSTGNLCGKAYALPTQLRNIVIDKWWIAKDDEDILCLIPRKKKGV